MSANAGGFAAQEITEFLAAITACEDDEDAAVRVAVERAAEAVEAEVAAVTIKGRVVRAIGYPEHHAPEDEIAKAASVPGTRLLLPPLGELETLAAEIGAPVGGRLLIGRLGTPFHPAEVSLIATMGRMLGLLLATARARAEERALLTQVEERSRLLERMSRIARSISHHAGLDDVLEAITEGASSLLSSPVASLRLRNPDSPEKLVLRSGRGLSDEVPEVLAVGDGVSGRAVAEDCLILASGLEASKSGRIAIAMAAPIHDEEDRAVGSLAVGTHSEDRRFSLMEQEALLGFAEHASLALADARAHDAMVKAQEARDMFLAMVSHELKTPLTVVMGALRTIEHHHDGLDHERRALLVESAFERGRQLEALIDRLLESTRAELTSIEQEVELSDLVGQALRGFEHSRALHCLDVPEVRLVADTTAVRRILETLLENAIAHSPDRTDIVIEAGVADEYVTIAVRNIGSLPEGIDPRQLFAPFRRGPGVISSGVGLGLHIASRLATSIGGDIGASSRDGMVTFRLAFPYRAPVTGGVQAASTA